MRVAYLALTVIISMLLQVYPVAAQEDELDVAVEITLIMMGLSQSSPIPNNLNAGANNQYVGFQPQGSDCTSDSGYASTVVGGFGPCAPGTGGAPNAGLQILNNLTPQECGAKMLQGATAASNAVVPGTENSPSPVSIPSVQTYGPPGSSGPLSGVSLPNTGGACGSNPSFTKPGVTFEGYVNGQFVIQGIDTIAPQACPFLLNMCSQGECTCGILSVNAP